ncbi:MAG: adenylosuccinate lyase, partial [Gammaproteobacteria bacterium]|nr:adenylosuccinate lyase [Gammaproteobacteria bacterium]
MKLSTLTSISPLCGRYAEQLTDTSPLFCDLHLTLIRLTVEIEWLKTLASNPKIKEIKPLDRKSLLFLHNIIAHFEIKDLERIRELEKQTNHDVKAIEYFLKEKLSEDKTLKKYQEFVHFGCTSDDINNLSYAITLSNARDEILLPYMKGTILQLEEMAYDYAKIPMLARTHGQAASPTTFGKEMANFAYRLTRQYDYLLITPILGKFNGAVGNFNAHMAAYPEIDWQKIEQKFIEKFDLISNPYTTQIEPHDWLAEYCDILARFNTITIGLCRDIWGYISIGYLKQKVKSNEVGSSTMPHKINPIDFENAEGNLGIANALLNHFSSKLPISRWQRDLTDSTVMRNLGVAVGHSVLAYKSLEKGLNKLTVDHKALKDDLNNHWEILAEAVQTVMRRHNIENPYEQMKNLTRGQKIDKKILHKFIKKLDIPLKAKQRLL